MISVGDARDHVLGRCPALAVVATPLDEALGLVLAEALVAREPVPPFANTAMDGYAVRAADTAAAGPGSPVRLDVVGSLAAGHAPGVEVGPGQAVRIMTGAPIPPGADSVVMVELTERTSDQVLVRQAAEPGDHIRRPGEDILPGQEVLAAGARLGPAQLGLAASLGAVALGVFRRPRVGVLSTGDELVEGPGPLAPGQIRDSNRRTLLALLRETGVEPVDLGIARDREEEIAAALEAAARRCDAVLTSGGVSVGDFDYVKVVLDRLCPGGMRWMQVAVRPAKPFAFGLLGDSVPVFGLPGNPVSSAVSFELFARPALRQMMGHTGRARFRPELSALAAEGFRGSGDGRLTLVRVRVLMGPDGRLWAGSAGGQASHVLSGLAAANALALVPAGAEIAPGAPVSIWLLEEDGIEGTGLAAEAAGQRS